MREHMAFKRQAMIQNRLDPDANRIDPEEKLRKDITKWIGENDINDGIDLKLAYYLRHDGRLLNAYKVCLL